jgi:ribonuclease HI
MSLRREFASFRTNHIERAQNARADALANEAMDTQSSTIQIDQLHKATSSKVNRLVSRGANDDVNVQDDETETVNNPGAASRSETMSRLDPQKTFVLFFDGGSRGNPGKAGAGMVLYDDDSSTEIWSGCQYLGEMSTNNVAEYRALITGLQIARSMGVENILVQGDSQLILRQIDGVYKVKGLRPYYDEAMSLRKEFASFRTNHIERARNSRADKLANEAMDSKCSRGIDVSQ